MFKKNGKDRKISSEMILQSSNFDQTADVHMNELSHFNSYQIKIQ